MPRTVQAPQIGNTMHQPMVTATHQEPSNQPGIAPFHVPVPLAAAPQAAPARTTAQASKPTAKEIRDFIRRYMETHSGQGPLGRTPWPTLPAQWSQGPRGVAPKTDRYSLDELLSLYTYPVYISKSRRECYPTHCPVPGCSKSYVRSIIICSLIFSRQELREPK